MECQGGSMSMNADELDWNRTLRNPWEFHWKRRVAITNGANR